MSIAPPTPTSCWPGLASNEPGIESRYNHFLTQHITHYKIYKSGEVNFNSDITHLMFLTHTS